MTSISYVKDAMQKKGVTLYRLSKLTGLKYELLRRTLHGKRKFPADEFITIMVKLNSLPTPQINVQNVGKPLAVTFADGFEFFRNFRPFEIAKQAIIIPTEPYAKKTDLKALMKTIWRREGEKNAKKEQGK